MNLNNNRENYMKKFAVIGVGNMATSILNGMISAQMPISDWIVYDKNDTQYTRLPERSGGYYYAKDIRDAVSLADCVLLSVKPQNFPKVLEEIRSTPRFDQKLYLSIAAGIDSQAISAELNHAKVIRILPNLPMTIGMGVSLICENSAISHEDMEFARDIFSSSGSTVMIRESEMNRMIGVTSSSPAYVFQFINAIYQGALAQGLADDCLIDTICDMVIGSAQLLKQQKTPPVELIARVASKGGTTERALNVLEQRAFDEIIKDAMIACTERADELGQKQ